MTTATEARKRAQRTDSRRKQVNELNSYAQLSLHLAHDRMARDQRDAADERRARLARPARADRSQAIRRSVGRRFITIGERLALEPEPELRPARSR